MIPKSDSVDSDGDRFATVGGLTLCYRVEGDKDGAPLLLLGGLGMQLTAWTDELCDRFGAQGFRVVRYDHRDAGRSTVFDVAGLPDLLGALRRDGSQLAYTLNDLADDAIGLLDALCIERAHLFGVSMGAMVGQLIAIQYPTRVLSLCSALGSTGARGVGQTSSEALAVLLRPAARTKEEAVAQWYAAWRVTRSPGFSYDEERERTRAIAAYERAHHPAGSARQLAAVLAAPDRTAALSSIECSVLVVHGEEDRLIDVSGGRATAAAIPGARLLLVPAMGHDLPIGVWEELVTAISENASTPR